MMLVSKLNIAVVDDNTSDYTYLRSRLEKWADNAEVSIEITHFSSGTLFLENIKANQSAYAVVFLDVLMPNTTGIDVARVLCEEYPKLLKVFYSSAIEYSCKGFVVNGIRYILKLADDVNAQIIECMNHIVRLISENEDNYYDVSTPKQLVPPIPCREIVSISSAGNYVLVQTLDGSIYKQRKLMKEAIELLPEQFVRCNRRSLINIRLIAQITAHSITMKDGSVFPISDAMQSQFVNMLEKLS